MVIDIFWVLFYFSRIIKFLENSKLIKKFVSVLLFIVWFAGVVFIGWLGYQWASPTLTTAESGKIVITQNGFRATGAIIESSSVNYDDPGTIHIDTHRSVTFKNGTTHPIKLCLSQRGDCITQTTGPRELRAGIILNPGEIRDVQFDDVADYHIMVYTPDGPTFKYQYLTISVTTPSNYRAIEKFIS